MQGFETKTRPFKEQKHDIYMVYYLRFFALRRYARKKCVHSAVTISG